MLANSSLHTAERGMYPLLLEPIFSLFLHSALEFPEHRIKAAAAGAKRKTGLSALLLISKS